MAGGRHTDKDTAAADRDTRKGAPASGEAPISPASPDALIPKPVNDNFPRIQVIGEIR